MTHVVTTGLQNDQYAPGYINAQTVYGAIGDGTHNDTTALQGAINAAGVNGGRVYIPFGTYLISSPLSMSSSNVIVYGDGQATILRNINSSSSIFSISGSSCAIQSLSIDGNKSKVTNGYGISSTSSSDLLIDSVIIDSTYMAGIAIDDGGSSTTPATRLTIKDCRITNCGIDASNANRSGIFLDGTITNSRITGNQIVNAGASFISAFAESASRVCSDVLVSDNTCTTSGDNGIKFQGGNSNFQHNRCRVIDNKITGVTIDGIRFDVADGLCEGNTIVSPGQSGIKTDGLTDCVWSGNIVTSAGQNGYGIPLTFGNLNGLLVTGNYAIGCTQRGFDMSANSGFIGTNIVVEANTFKDNTSNGIKTTSTTPGNTISFRNNFISGNVAGDINLSGSNFTYSNGIISAEGSVQWVQRTATVGAQDSDVQIQSLTAGSATNEFYSGSVHGSTDVIRRLRLVNNSSRASAQSGAIPLNAPVGTADPVAGLTDGDIWFKVDNFAVPTTLTIGMRVNGVTLYK